MKVRCRSRLGDDPLLQIELHRLKVQRIPFALLDRIVAHGLDPQPVS